MINTQRTRTYVTVTTCIGDGDVTMPNDKYKLKDEIFRRPPFGTDTVFDDAVTEPRPGQMIDPACIVAGARPIVGVVEDGSVRLCQVISAGTSRNSWQRARPLMCGRDVAASFRVAIDSVLGSSAFADCRTYVLAFDKYEFVPDRKRRVQRKRDAAVNTQAARNDDARWEWDGQSSICTPNALVPPWSQLGTNRPARVRAMQDVADQLLADYRPPPGCRLVLDVPDRPTTVIERLNDGRSLEPYSVASLTNRIGEGDIVCQFYAQRLMRADDAMTVSDTEASRIAVRTPKSMPNADLFAELVPNTDDDVPVCGAIERPTYVGGSVVVRTNDTDLIVLGMLHQENEAADTTSRMYVASANVIYRMPDSPAYCKSTEEGARAFYETYDCRAMCERVWKMHRVPAHDVYARRLAVASFVTFCFATGNDYINRRNLLGHRIMFSAYQDFITRTSLVEDDDDTMSDEEHSLDGVAPAKRRRTSRSLVRFDADDTHFNDERAARHDALYCGHLRVDEREFRAFIKDCYRHRSKPASRPHASIPWDRLDARISTRSSVPANCMPSLDELEQWRSAVEWYLRYAVDHVYGVVPPV